MKIKKNLNFTALRRKASEVFSSVPDERQESKISISIHDAMMSGLACMHFQDPSLLQFQERMQVVHHSNNLKTLFDVENIPKETQMREIIDGVSSDYFKSIFKDYYLRLQRNKTLEKFQIFPGKYYFPIDGSEFFSSKEVNCAQCLTKEHKTGETTYSHYVLQGGIMHPDCSEVIPFMPEQIVNTDGTEKQDCEMNAAKRYIKNLHENFRQLKLIIGGDSLFSRQPIIEDIRTLGMDYLFAAKETDHAYMTEWLNAYATLYSHTFIDEKGRTHLYEWMNDVPLYGGEKSIHVNYLRCTISGKKNKKDKGEDKILFRNSWVTDISISSENIVTLVNAGRCRWKNENEVFNVMKNHGYCMEHNYGHGEKNLAYNFYLLTLLAFTMHQIFELTCHLYQRCRKKFGSKRFFWENVRGDIKRFLFTSWEQLLEFLLDSTGFQIVPIVNSA